MKKVYEIDVNEIGDYVYYAYFTVFTPTKELTCFLGSDSLNNLKKEIKQRGITIAWISTNKGMLSYGQNICNTIPYIPRCQNFK